MKKCQVGQIQQQVQNQKMNYRKNAIDYIQRIEELIDTRVDIISTGPDRNETIVLNDLISESI